MARKIDSRLKIAGILTAQTPLHVGGYGESFETDMALAKNGNDEFYIPGTSLTGTLRSWFEKAFGETEMESLFGNKQAEFASFVLIEDLPLSEQVQSELRDGVGIDRYYGTAADKAKYDRAILPKGTELKFEMTVEIGEKHVAAKTRAMFGHLLEALRKGEIRLGASKTRGLGRIKFEPQEIAENSFKSFEEILKSVQKQSSKTYSIEELKAADSAVKTAPNQKLEITIEWQPKSPLMVKAGYDGIGVDTLPLTSANGTGQVSLCLPGSSVKGAFRAQAERILRTFSGETAKDAKDFHDQIKMDLINELFGSKKETAQSNLGLGALSIDDCFAEKSMNAETWQAVESGEFPNDETYSAAKLHQALKKIDGEENQKTKSTKDFHISHHTAIDRFTGAASDGALFSVLTPSPQIAWENLNLSLDLSRLGEANKLSSLMLLLLVLRDFAQNRLPLGFATNRGMGEIEEKTIEIAISSEDYEIQWEKGEKKFTFSKGNQNDLQGEWQKWIKNQEK